MLDFPAKQNLVDNRVTGCTKIAWELQKKRILVEYMLIHRIAEFFTQNTLCQETNVHVKFFVISLLVI